MRLNRTSSDSFSPFSLPSKPRRAASAVMFLAPTLEVMTIMVFLKSTFRPWESVTIPSSRICSRMFHTSSWAFSISSNSTTEYGFLRTFSVSWPPSSWPT